MGKVKKEAKGAKKRNPVCFNFDDLGAAPQTPPKLELPRLTLKEVQRIRRLLKEKRWLDRGGRREERSERETSPEKGVGAEAFRTSSQYSLGHWSGSQPTQHPAEREARGKKSKKKAQDSPPPAPEPEHRFKIYTFSRYYILKQ